MQGTKPAPTGDTAGTDQAVLFEVRDRVATITLNRPDALNAINADLSAGLMDALRRVRSDDAIRVAVLTGTGRAFCVGQDLREHVRLLGEGAEALWTTVPEHYNPIVTALATMPKPVIAAVNGVAAGAGANLALACDIVIAGRSASFLQAFARIGLMPDAGGTFMLPRLVGEARAKGLAMLAEPLPAETAAHWGLIWKVVDDSELMSEALALAQRLASGPTVALGLIKRAIEAASRNDLSQQLDVERELQAEAARTRDFVEGVTAFLEKRRPEFRGQ
jgi:2-(1,2-epoxy-1,2-dihydrophenyl)acetyl-CoA isomerase